MANEPDSWWVSLNHSGILLSPSQVSNFEEPLDTFWKGHEDFLRLHIQRQIEKPEQVPGELTDFLFGILVRWNSAQWDKNPGPDHSLASYTGKTIKPWRIYKLNPDRSIPVFLPEKEERSKYSTLARDKKFFSRVLEWMRRKNFPIGLVSNGVTWRLVHAGADWEAWCEWDLATWFEEGGLGQQGEAWRRILGDPEKTFEAILSSKATKGTLSKDLGERVRKAVELLISCQSERLKVLEPTEENRRSLYLAAVRLVMRCVVILFAEARDLLPRSNPVYAQSYSLESLKTDLKRRRTTHKEGLRQGRSAWPRLVSLFRLVYSGSSHEALPLTKYGGGLFEPGDKESLDPIKRALGILEDPFDGPTDWNIAQVLTFLSETTMRLKQGRATVRTAVPVDFSDLSSEYIGILYEGLLDFELRQVGSDAMVFVNVGTQPALDLSAMEAMDVDQIKELFKAFKSKDKSDDDGIEDDIPEDIPTEEMEEPPETDDEESPLEDRSFGDLIQDRLKGWTLKAVKAMGIKKKKNESDLDYQSRSLKESEQLIKQVLLPGEWFLVRWGGTRKGAGTFYTPPGLALPTVQKTLEPMLFDLSESRTPKTPDEILSLKVADIAMGSGSFLISALRVITEALYESLWYHKRLQDQGDKTLVRLADGRHLGSFSDDPIPVTLDSQDFEPRLKGRLKRHVVERCLYGVDLDPLAVELARLALWVETMDYNIPFGFLDHKLKSGNSLVGCRLNHLSHYPLNAFNREGPEKKHPWTEAYKKFRDDTLRKEMRSWINDVSRKQLALDPNTQSTLTILHNEAFKVFEKLHNLPIHEVEARQKAYQEEILANPALQALKDDLDLWCALWFWPGDKLDLAPLPRTWKSPTDEQSALVRALAQRERFFHWEWEFPDVFTGPKTGFTALIGNPPWETQKPNSKEFFSNIDPLYRSYGKQEGLKYQEQYFVQNPAHRQSWDVYRDRFKALSGWVTQVANPFGDPEVDQKTAFSLGNAKENTELHDLWRTMGRPNVSGFRSEEKVFTLQGGGDLNTYKLFLEQVWTLLKNDGILGLIVPGSIYSDEGSGTLRKAFLEKGRWEWLFAFENREKIFDIHGSFKFCALIVLKGGKTESVKSSFMNRKLESWSQPQYLKVTPSQLQKFSPQSLAFLEVQSQKDMDILEKIYANSILLGDSGPKGWGVKYAREFDMTNDSHLFPPIQTWEAKGYRGDEYGHWLLGDWKPYTGPLPSSGPVSPLTRPEKTILSADRQWVIAWEDVKDVALPLYQGVMIHQFDHAFKGYVSGAGNRAVWEEIPWDKKVPRPQFLMSQSSYYINKPFSFPTKIVFRDVTNATNQNSIISTILGDFPCGNVLGTLTSSLLGSQQLQAALGSLVCDWAIRQRLSGTHLNWFIAAEIPVLDSTGPIQKLEVLIERLTKTGSGISNLPTQINLYKVGVSTHERKRLRTILDAVLAFLYSLKIDDLKHILSGCDHPCGAIPRNLDPKGFWRVDQDLDPELRHTVLTQVAFADLQEKGLDAFLAQNNGEGWMIPETLRLADYCLGHDDRANEHQPVASRLGPRFFDWQLTKSPEEAELERQIHARNIEYIRSLGKVESPKSNKEDKKTVLQNELGF